MPECDFHGEHFDGPCPQCVKDGKNGLRAAVIESAVRKRYESELALLRRQRDELAKAAIDVIEILSGDSYAEVERINYVCTHLRVAIERCTPSPALDSEPVVPKGAEFGKDPIQNIKAKCEQYWNESGIGDAEVHSMLAFIHRQASALDSGAGHTSGPAPEGLARTIFDYWCASPFSPVSKPDREMSWGMRDTRESFMHLARRERRLLRDAARKAFQAALSNCRTTVSEYLRDEFPDVTDEMSCPKCGDDLDSVCDDCMGEVDAVLTGTDEPIPVPDDESEIAERLNLDANGVDQ